MSSKAATEAGGPASKDGAAKPASKAAKSRAEESLASQIAKLEFLAADTGEGAHASIIREVARLTLDKIHLKRTNLRVWSVTGILGVGLITAVVMAFSVYPKYRYIPTTDAKAVCEVGTQDTLHISIASLADFTKDTVVDSYTYDYVNYRKSIDDVTSRRYTSNGRKAFLKSLDESGNLERVRQGRLTMRAFTTNAPQVEADGGPEGIGHFWTVQVPIGIEFYVGGQPAPSNTQDFLAETTVMKEQPSALNPSGLSVDSVVLRPFTRKK